jgi:hypothetical protein
VVKCDICFEDAESMHPIRCCTSGIVCEGCWGRGQFEKCPFCRAQTTLPPSGPDRCVECDRLFDQYQDVLSDDDMSSLWLHHQDEGNDEGDLCR